MTKKRKPTKNQKHVRTYEQNSDEPITPVEYGGLQAAFDYLNAKLFDGALPNVFITYQRRAHSGGYFSPDRFASRVSEGGHHEIALNPDGFIGKTDEFIVSILLHEMVHLWQHIFAKRPSRAYHDKQWAAKMKSLGLMPSNTGAVGGKETGAQMAHYIIPNAAFATAFAALAATGWKLNLQSAIFAGGSKAPPSKVKFTCPSCGSNMWGKPDSKDICGECHQWRRTSDTTSSPSVAAAQSYDQETGARGRPKQVQG